MDHKKKMDSFWLKEKHKPDPKCVICKGDGYIRYDKRPRLLGLCDCIVKAIDKEVPPADSTNVLKETTARIGNYLRGEDKILEIRREAWKRKEAKKDAADSSDGKDQSKAGGGPKPLRARPE